MTYTGLRKLKQADLAVSSSNVFALSRKEAQKQSVLTYYQHLPSSIDDISNYLPSLLSTFTAVPYRIWKIFFQIWVPNKSWSLCPIFMYLYAHRFTRTLLSSNLKDKAAIFSASCHWPTWR